MEYDEAVVKCFLEGQQRLFPRKVAATFEEAEEFLESSMAVVVNSPREVWDYFQEEGLDLDGVGKDTILEAEEVFAVGDGRYLIVEG